MSTAELVKEWIERNRDRLIADLMDACAIPSVSTNNPEGVQAMADWLSTRLDTVLDDVRQVPLEGNGPIVIGHAAGTGAPSILLYSHYDVQPAEVDWSTEPFTPTLTDDGSLRARGAADDKADVVARIHALEALREITGNIPCNVVWLSEGAEEVGSPGLGEFVTEHADELRADACLWESYLRDAEGRPEIGFGARGMVYLELRVTPLASDQHSAFAGVFRSAPVELAAAVSTLVDIDGRVLVDGFTDGLPQPSAVDLEAVASIPSPVSAAEALPGIRSLVNRESSELAGRMVLEATLNVAGLLSGFTGPGAMTIVPATAMAKIDIRTVPGQTEEFVVSKLRAHLDKRGFTDVEVVPIHSVPASKSDMDSPFGRAVSQAATELYGKPVRYPMVPGAGPLHLVGEALDIAIVAPPGSTRMVSNIHGPNESILVEDYLAHVAFTARALELWGDVAGAAATEEDKT